LFLLTKYGSECALDLKILYDPLGQSFKLNGECQYGYIRFKGHLVSINGKEGVLNPYILRVGGELCLLIGVRSCPLLKE
jgi:hypothetical protein